MHRKALNFGLAILFVATGCRPNVPAAPFLPITLTEGRSGFQTRLIKHEKDGTVPQKPPEGMFRLVKYPSPAGELSAYVGTPPPGPSKRPAIIWLIGGFSNSIGDIAWTPGPPENEQSASAFRQAGIIMMYPSLRGGNDNPGFREGFYGEVDDVLAAAKYLAGVEGVDPQRIYLGGHSTGGTLALLTAETGTHLFRAVFAFGPVADVGDYGPDPLPFHITSRLERKMRAPGVWLNGISVPTYIMEGTEGRSNIASFQRMEKIPHPQDVAFQAVPGANHFSLLAPLTRLLAQKIMEDREGSPRFNLLSAEIVGAVNK